MDDEELDRYLRLVFGLDEECGEESLLEQVRDADGIVVPGCYRTKVPPDYRE